MPLANIKFKICHCRVKLLPSGDSYAATKIADAAAPAEPGYAMPAEWERHEATWLGWPHNETDWPDKLDTIRWVYGEMVRKISAGELVRILVRHQAEQKLATSYLKYEVMKRPYRFFQISSEPMNRIGIKNISI